MTLSLVLVLCVLALLCVAGVLVVRKFGISSDDSDGAIGTLIAPCVLSIYLIAMAMGLVIGWENNQGAGDGLTDEAATATALYWSTGALPEEQGARVRADLRDYLETSVRDDWPRMRERALSPEGDTALQRLRTSVHAIDTGDDPAAALDRLTARQEVADLAAQRVQRADAAGSEIPRVVTLAATVSALAVVVLPFGMGVRGSRTRIFWALLNLVFVAATVVLLLYLDNPYTGALAIGPDALTAALEGFDRIDAAIGAG
ncbi:bestrophin-like domain [Nocardiopsis trehalosi]|jgi:hypothetical protein|uniref:bestrophin-like domain n=1 Tax=Nocardiopsis trehalosi TaxID=109329 RepID=UPI00082CA16F|nr:DUF4239 domain-containing protein [Nocardiopsis trehalosi]